MVQTRNMSRSLVILPWTLAGVLVVAFASKLYVTFGGSATAPNAARGQMVTMRARGDSTKTKAYLVEPLESGQAAREPEQLPWGVFLGVVAAAATAVGIAMNQTSSDRNPMQAATMSSSTLSSSTSSTGRFIDSFASVNRGVELADSVVRPQSVPEFPAVPTFSEWKAAVKHFGNPAEHFKAESEKAFQAVTANVAGASREISQAAGYFQANFPKFQQSDRENIQAGIGMVAAAAIVATRPPQAAPSIRRSNSVGARVRTPVVSTARVVQGPAIVATRQAQAVPRSHSVSAPVRTSVVYTPHVVQGPQWNRSADWAEQMSRQGRSITRQMRSVQQTAELRQLLLGMNPVPVYR